MQAVRRLDKPAVAGGRWSSSVHQPLVMFHADRQRNTRCAARRCVVERLQISGGRAP
jgi:hypothetical protein